jgi:hypothetical protein
MSEMMGDRLSEIIQHYRYTMNSFAKKLGLTSNTVITKAVKESQLLYHLSYRPVKGRLRLIAMWLP